MSEKSTRLYPEEEAEILYKTYNILFSDLIVDKSVPCYFDGIGYYIHTKTGKKYSYDSFGKYWLVEEN